MKRILRVGEGCVLFRDRLKYPNIKYLSLLAVLTTMCLYAVKQVSAQVAEPAATAFEVDTVHGLVINDRIPEWFWDISLNLVYDPEGKESMQLRDYKDQLLVLDFWGAYCKPCIRSLNKWDTLQRQFPDDVAVVGIHLFYPTKLAQPFAHKSNWSFPVATGNHADTLMNSMFYAQRRFGQVWIKDGRLLAIPKSKAVSKELIAAIIARVPVKIEMEESLTYFDPRLKSTKSNISKP